MTDIKRIAQEIERAYEENRSYRHFGIWGHNGGEGLEIGDLAPKSYDTSDESEWGAQVNGTSTIGLNWQGDGVEALVAELAEKMAYHKCTYLAYDNYYIVAGSDYEYGQDDMEWVIQYAHIIVEVK